MSAAGFYHCSAKGVGRAKGRSVVAAAAYRSGERLADEISGQTFDYRARGGVAEKFILTRDDAPSWAHTRERLWNEAERVTDRSNARIANEFVLALPHELDADQRRQLVKDFLAPLIEKYGVAADVAIHEPGKGRDGRNHHAHVLLTHRELGPDGFGEIANTRVMTRKRDGVMVEERVSGIIAAVPDVFAQRKNWEQAVNRAYERAGLDIRVDHRSHDDRGLDQKPTIHLGPAAAEMERRKPGSSERGDINRKIVAANSNRQKIATLEAEVEKISAQIIDLKAERSMRAAHEAAKGRYDRLDDTHRQVARDQFPGRYDELKAATPAPEIARQFETSARRAGETAAPIWDRDADNAAWDAKIADSGKDAPEARQQPGDRAGSDMRAEAGSAAGGQQHRPEAEDTRPLGKTAGEIRTAWSLTRAGGDLEEALASRGIALAKVTGDEARASERAAAFAKEVGNFGRALKEGETVAVNQYGDVHRIDARTTGDLRPEIEGRLAGLDLLSVTDAKEAMREAARASLASEAREWRDMNTPPTGIETTIADALENTMTGTAFAAALDDAGLTITRATESDVTALGALRHDESLARLAAETNGEARRDHHFARLEPGDFAAVTRAGDVFRLNPTALDFEEAQQRLADTQTGLPCVVEARAVNEIAREETAQLAAQWRADNTAAGIAWSDAKETQHEMREPLQAGRDALGTATAETVEIGFDVAGGVAKGMTKLIDMLGGFFDFLIGEAKLSPQQIELAERAAAERAEAKADIFAEQSKIAAADALNFRQDRQQAEDKLMIEVYGYVPGRPPDPNTDRAADREDDYDRERERERY